MRDRLRLATRTADETVGLHNQRISAEAVRNCLREAHLRASCPHQGPDLTAVWSRNRPQWETAHLQWPLARWRSVLFTDGKQRVWREQSAP